MPPDEPLMVTVRPYDLYLLGRLAVLTEDRSEEEQEAIERIAVALRRHYG